MTRMPPPAPPHSARARTSVLRAPSGSTVPPSVPLPPGSPQRRTARSTQAPTTGAGCLPPAGILANFRLPEGYSPDDAGVDETAGDRCRALEGSYAMDTVAVPADFDVDHVTPAATSEPPATDSDTFFVHYDRGQRTSGRQRGSHRPQGSGPCRDSAVAPRRRRRGR
ncbi:hypothetical protein E4K10_26910 [Streptomyces sp. T1317-0309]|nr:hypothetical protein E4K10_26910 [Streptomyces sp. T1317-0309]